MKTYFNKIKSFVAVAAFTMSAMQAFSQARETTTAPVPVNGPMDYGKDASTQKLHKHIISFGFFSLLNQHISFGYDQLLGNDMVLTTQLGIIGPSATANANTYAYSASPVGAFVEGGLKLFFAPDFVTVGTMRYNSMQGYYFKPQVSISSFNLTQTSYASNSYPPYTTTVSSNNTANYTGVAFMLSLGKQWILAHSVSLDIYAGIGYAIGGTSSNNDAPSNYYSFESTGIGAGGAGVAISGGVNIGLPF